LYLNLLLRICGDQLAPLKPEAAFAFNFNALSIKAGIQNKAQAHGRSTLRGFRVSAPFPYPDFNTPRWMLKADEGRGEL
jgi:hypothetical protein